MGAMLDLVGQNFGRLTVVRFHHSDGMSVEEAFELPKYPTQKGY